MLRFYKFISSISHPLFMPIIGVYFIADKIPHKLPFSFYLFYNVLPPLLLVFYLKKRNLINSIEMCVLDERKIPLLVQLLLCVIQILILFGLNENIVYLSFFTSILLSTFLCFVFLFVNIKASLHLIGVSGVFGFLFSSTPNLDFFNIMTSILVVIIVSIIRVKLKAHTVLEVVFGAFIGFFSSNLLYKI